MRALARLLLPAGVDPAVLPLLVGRGLRAFADGYVAVLLPAYLLALGFGQFDVGLLSTATLAGSAVATLAVGAVGHRWPPRVLLLGAALLMTATGIGFAGVSAFWPLLVVAFFGTINPGSGDVSVFLPLEHARLAHAAERQRAHRAFRALFAHRLAVRRGRRPGRRIAALAGRGRRRPAALRAARDVRPLRSDRRGDLGDVPPAPGQQGRIGARSDAARDLRGGIVFRLAALFSVDSFAGGLVVNSLLTLWLFERFGLSLGQAGLFFFWSGLLAAFSQLAAPVVARRIGLLNTMVFTHIPANVFLILAALSPSLPVALGLLFARSALSQMDVPTRTAFVMAAVTPAERAAAASFTAVPRSLASAASPTLAGALLAAGLLSVPLVACGALKIAYDIALLVSFRRLRLPPDSK